MDSTQTVYELLEFLCQSWGVSGSNLHYASRERISIEVMSIAENKDDACLELLQDPEWCTHTIMEALASSRG